MGNEKQAEAVHAYLKQSFCCGDAALAGEGVTFTVSETAAEPSIRILLCGAAAVVCTSPGLREPAERLLRGRSRDELLECPLAYGQTIHYLPDRPRGNEAPPPGGFTYELLSADELYKLCPAVGFENALTFDSAGNTQARIALAARDGDAVAGLAAADGVTGRLWEVGVDVRPEYRRHGLGAALMRRLTREILDRGVVPFYSASIANVPSQRTAARAGYAPYWVDSFGTLFDGHYAYAAEDVRGLLGI